MGVLWSNYRLQQRPNIVWTALIEDNLACKAQAMKKAEHFSLQELTDKYFIEYAIFFTTKITASSYYMRGFEKV